MSTMKHCMFIPPEFGGKEISPFALWDQFDLDSVDQGFDETGQYYLLFQDDFDQMCIIQAVYFDHELLKLKSNLIEIKFPEIEVENPIRSFLFDKHGAQVVHAIQRYSKNGVDRVDLYHFCFYGLLITKCDHHIEIDNSQKADLSLEYVRSERFSFVKFDYQCRHREVTTLMVHAFNRLPCHNNDRTKQRVDLIHTSNGKIWHSRTILLDLNVCIRYISSFSDVNLFLTRDMLYVYGNIVNKTFKTWQFDLNGQYITSYCSLAPVDGINGLNHHNHYLHVLSSGENDDELRRILKLRHGKVEVLVEWDNGVLTGFVQPDRRENFIVDGILNRFGQILAQYRIFKENGLCQFHFVDLKTNETVMEFCVPKDPMSYGNFNLNWNSREYSLTYFDNEHLFKVSRINSHQITLKHFARLAVLTSFSEEYLAKQNLPKSLFDYLGIDK
uniref:Uncharacterized protein n=1 Tax=Clytia hemisphaerica TaxID=252671 RepID=A0A7M6DKP8_9CNID